MTTSRLIHINVHCRIPILENQTIITFDFTQISSIELPILLCMACYYMLLAYHTLSLVQAVAVLAPKLLRVFLLLYALLLLAPMLLPLSMMLAPNLLQVLAYCYLHPYSCPCL